jgi:hypothetical protein
MGRHYLPAILVLLLVVLGVAAVRIAFVRGAHHILVRWEAGILSGASGEPPRPKISLFWPPRVEWRNLHWRFTGGGELVCDRLNIRLLPLPMLRGRLVVGSVDLDTLRLVGRLDLELWATRFLRAATARPDAELSAPSDPRATRISVRALAGGSSPPGLIRLEGWGWASGAGRWNLLARGRTAAGFAIEVNGRGVESPGRREGSVGIVLDSQRKLQLDWKRGAGLEPFSQLALEDDGLILGTLLDSLPVVGTVSPSGGINLTLARTGNRPVEGEARLDGLQISRAGGDPLRVQGLVCIQAGMASLQDFQIRANETDILVRGDFPLSPDSAGSLGFDGVWNGRRLLVEGALSVTPDSVTWLPTGIRLGDATAGHARIAWLKSAGGAAGLPRAMGALRGRIAIEAGEVHFEGTGGSGGSIRVQAKGIPFEKVIPWLPFDLPGDWSGLLDGTGRFQRQANGWTARGTAVARDGRVTGLDLLDEIGGLTGSAGRGAVRFHEARTQWSYRSGELLADSLVSDAGRMRINGALFYAGADSLLGILRLSPAEDKGIASLLRLLGGSEGSLDLGIRGSLKHPEIEPLDRVSIVHWQTELDRLRGRFADSIR